MENDKEERYRVVNYHYCIEKPHPLETYGPYEKFTGSYVIKEKNFVWTIACQNIFVGTLLNPLSRLKILKQIFPGKKFEFAKPKSIFDCFSWMFRGNLINGIMTLITTKFNASYRPHFFGYTNFYNIHEKNKDFYWQMAIILSFSNMVCELATYPLDRWRTLVYVQQTPTFRWNADSFLIQIVKQEGLSGLWKGFKFRLVLNLLQNVLFAQFFANFRLKSHLNQEVSLMISVLLTGILVYPFDTHLKIIQNELGQLAFRSRSTKSILSFFRKVLTTPLRYNYSGFSFFIASNSVIFSMMGLNYIK